MAEDFTISEKRPAVDLHEKMPPFAAWIRGEPGAVRPSDDLLRGMLQAAQQLLEPDPKGNVMIWVDVPDMPDQEVAMAAALTNLIATFRDHYGVDEAAITRVMTWLGSRHGARTIKESGRTEH